VSEENHKKTLVRIAGVLVKISASELPNISLMHYHCTNMLLVLPVFFSIFLPSFFYLCMNSFSSFMQTVAFASKR
jgi:hypothetical protein